MLCKQGWPKGKANEALDLSLPKTTLLSNNILRKQWLLYKWYKSIKNDNTSNRKRPLKSVESTVVVIIKCIHIHNKLCKYINFNG